MYITRLLEEPILKRLNKGKIIIIYGARQVGKTTLVKSIADKSGIPFSYINCDEGSVQGKLMTADTSLALKALTGSPKLVILDEAQRIRDIGIKLKLLVDTYPEQQIIATGSSAFELSNEINEPLTGRVFEFWLFPFSAPEILKDRNLFEKERLLENLLVYGSYPEVYQMESNEEKAEKVRYIASNYLYKDILKFNNLKNSDIVIKLLRALAFQIGNEVSYNELANLVEVSKQTISDYIRLLEKAYIIFRLNPFSRNLRKELGKLRKIYFFDLGIRNALINNLNGLNLRDDIGKLWENFVVSEKYKSQLGPGFKTNYYFWRTYDGAEIDLVEDINGQLYGWEMKWSGKAKKAPKAWRDTYPKATWEIISPDSYLRSL